MKKPDSGARSRNPRDFLTVPVGVVGSVVFVGVAAPLAGGVSASCCVASPAPVSVGPRSGGSSSADNVEAPMTGDCRADIVADATLGGRRGLAAQSARNIDRPKTCLHGLHHVWICQREQQVLQVREGVAHVQRAQVALAHELMPRRGHVSDVMMSARNSALTISMSLFSKKTPYSNR